MNGELHELVIVLEKQLQDQGFVRYSMKLSDEQPTLIMYDTAQKRFAVFAFSPDKLGKYSRVDVWLPLAESKAEMFGGEEVPPYEVSKSGKGVWTVTVKVGKVEEKKI